MKWSGCNLPHNNTRRMQGIVGASGKFILFLSSMFFLLLSRTYMHACVQLQSGFS